jgi:hypothetical protein
MVIFLKVTTCPSPLLSPIPALGSAFKFSLICKFLEKFKLTCPPNILSKYNISQRTPKTELNFTFQNKISSSARQLTLFGHSRPLFEHSFFISAVELWILWLNSAHSL